MGAPRFSCFLEAPAGAAADGLVVDAQAWLQLGSTGWLGIGRRAMGMTDACCNRRFDEGAIKGLVERHGPMVLSLCRRVLRDPHDAGGPPRRRA